MTEQVLVRGPAPVVEAFRAELQRFVAQQAAPAAAFVPEPEPVRSANDELHALGHEAWVQLALNMSQAVAVGVMTSVVKALVIDWIKAKAKGMGLWVRTSEA